MFVTYIDGWMDGWMDGNDKWKCESAILSTAGLEGWIYDIAPLPRKKQK